MGNNDLNVIPSQEMIDAANQSAGNTKEYLPENENEAAATMEMRNKTEEQIRIRKHITFLEKKLYDEGKLDERERLLLEQLKVDSVVRRPDLAENPNNNQIGTVIEQPAPESPQPKEIDSTMFPATNGLYNGTENYPQPVKVNNRKENNYPQGYRPVQKEVSNQSYDMVPLPSDGKIYQHKRKTIKMAYLNGADENILTSPNLIQSGEFLNVLMERKILDADIELDDLHPGDRNALLIWLRATGLGSKYPIVLQDPDNLDATPVEVDFDLGMLKTKSLGAEPDSEGLFDYTFGNGSKIKFKLLTIRDISTIETYIEYEREVLKLDAPNILHHRFRRQIVEVNGDRSDVSVDNLLNTIRLRDERDFTKYIEKIESGVDMNIEVAVPGREQPIRTTFPLTPEFFWG